MTSFGYGPVELYLVGLDGDRPSPGVVGALSELLEGGLVRLLDFVTVARSDDGEVTVTEIEDETDEYGFGGADIVADLQKLASLRDAGALSDGEFEAAKTKLLT